MGLFLIFEGFMTLLIVIEPIEGNSALPIKLLGRQTNNPFFPEEPAIEEGSPHARTDSETNLLPHKDTHLKELFESIFWPLTIPSIYLAAAALDFLLFQVRNALTIFYALTTDGCLPLNLLTFSLQTEEITLT
uniref:Uncharacterized protein n=1 Tax=Glossina brevipalpis TaxID=37001 RepID=A0A1A9WFA7_9MUSC